jgi:hypothetical protein
MLFESDSVVLVPNVGHMKSRRMRAKNLYHAANIKRANPLKLST